MGFNLLNLGADVLGLMDYFGKIVDQLQGIAHGSSKTSGPY
jgi:hypothetical protein